MRVWVVTYRKGTHRHVSSIHATEASARSVMHEGDTVTCWAVQDRAAS